MHRFIEWVGKHLQGLRELAYVTARLFSFFGKSWCLREVPENHKKANITSVFEAGKKEKLQNYSLSDSPQPLGTWCSKDSWKPF